MPQALRAILMDFSGYTLVSATSIALNLCASHVLVYPHPTKLGLVQSFAEKNECFLCYA